MPGPEAWRDPSVAQVSGPGVSDGVFLVCSMRSGQVYCSTRCRALSRQQQLCAARARYQRSARSRELHRLRQRRYRRGLKHATRDASPALERPVAHLLEAHCIGWLARRASCDHDRSSVPAPISLVPHHLCSSRLILLEPGDGLVLKGSAAFCSRKAGITGSLTRFTLIVRPPGTFVESPSASSPPFIDASALISR